MQRPIDTKEKILKFAENNEKIRAVLLNASRANPNIKPDKYQDFDFKVSIGKSGKFIEKYLESSIYEEILITYTDTDIEKNWNALFLMTRIFKEQQKQLSQNLNFDMNEDETNNALKYIEKLREE